MLPRHILEKARKFERGRIEEEDDPEELLAKVIEIIKRKEVKTEEMETAINEVITYLNNPENFKVDYETVDSEKDALTQEQAINSLEQGISLFKTMIETHDEYISTFKSSKELMALSEVVSPKLVMRMESVSEQLDNIVENLELALKFYKEFSEIEPLLEKYGKQANKLDLSTKCGKT